MALYLKVIAFIFLVVGALMVYTARPIVSKFALDAGIKCDFENEMSEEELRDYKFKRAVVNFKMIGMLVILPGLIMVLMLYK